jgi:hypothetical protein
MKWTCKIGIHHWYRGQFSYPVWGRWERHCLECEKRQYRIYENKRHKWITYEEKK